MFVGVFVSLHRRALVMSLLLLLAGWAEKEKRRARPLCRVRTEYWELCRPGCRHKLQLRHSQQNPKTCRAGRWRRTVVA